MATLVERNQNIAENEKKKELVLTGEALISFISGTQTNIGKSTFYNLKDEQRQAMIDQHDPVLKQARPFYTLMALPSGVNDVNKQLIAYNIIKNTFRESNLKDHQHSPTTMWENEVLLQAFENMQPNRVLDFIVELRSKRIAKKRAMFFVYEWLRRNKNRWGLWAIKYRKDFKSILKHTRHNYRKIYSDSELGKIWEYLRNNNSEGCGKIIQDYVAVQKGDQSKLAKLPASVAEGFKKKFNLDDEAFWKLFKQEGGKFTAKEKRVKDAQIKRAGIEEGTKADIRKMKLFDALIYLKAQDQLPMPKGKIEAILDEKAKEIADKMLFKLDKVGLIFDTSLSMAGTKEQAFHPMLRGMAISRVIKQVSNEFKEYRTNESDGLFPFLKNQSNYSDAIIKALKDGCNTLVIVGDGYENAPFEGCAHQILFTYKKKLDKENKLMVFHLNPVFASEAMDVRSLSNLAPQVGVREVGSLNESMFLAIAKQKPMLAIKGYLKYLANLQNEKTKALMPEEVKKIVNARKVKLLEE